VPPAGAPPAPGAVNPSTPAQIIVTSGPEFRVAAGPYTVPISINNASRVSVITLTVTYNPAVLRVRTIQDGTFMRQGGATASFTPRQDANAGRVDIAFARTGDQTGASGTGLLAALLVPLDRARPERNHGDGRRDSPEGPPHAGLRPVSVTVR
jgi:hypothetical protein